MRLVECVPNFSEGRRPEVVAAIRDAIAAVDGVTILDVSSDQSHNRTRHDVRRARSSAPSTPRSPAFARRASSSISHHHTGEHPRMGATDVVPFIPLEGTTMEDCIVLARTLGERVGTRARDSRVPLRARRHDAGARESRRRPPRRVRGHSRRDEGRRGESHDPTSVRRTCTRPPAPSRSARDRSSSRTTSTSDPRRTSPSPRTSRRPCAARPADCAT